MKTVSDFCMSMALEAINREINDRRICIYEMPAFGSREIKLGVNWSAIGTVAPEEAADFAAKLARAAEIAKSHPMNGAMVVY